MELRMADEKSHTKQGQIERAQRLRQMIEDLKEDRPESGSSSEPKSLKEQIDERARELEKNKTSSNSE